MGSGKACTASEQPISSEQPEYEIEFDEGVAIRLQRPMPRRVGSRTQTRLGDRLAVDARLRGSANALVSWATKRWRLVAGTGMTCRVGVLAVLIAAILSCVSRAAAQPPAATAAPHPSMPWNQYSRPDYGQPIRYIEVPAQQMIMAVPVNVPAGVPPETQQQIAEIPGLRHN
jgi:hypothetical protein